MRAMILLLTAAAAALGQSDSGVITITATRTMPAQPVSATVQVQVTVPQNATLDDALAVISAAGFTAADWTGVSGQVLDPATGSAPQPGFTWNFSRIVTAAELPVTLAPLQSKSGSSLYYSVSTASSHSPECNYAALIGDAQSQAARIAEAAGMKLGGIVSLAKGAQVQLAQIPTAVYRTGDFSAALSNERVGTASFLLGQISTVPPPPSACTLIVQLKLVG
jgi:hypothetical protein